MIYSPGRSLFIVLIAGLLAGCASTAPTLAPTVAPTATAVPTATHVPTPGPTIQPGDIERTLMVDGLERSYILHIPPGLDSLRPIPVVLAFHDVDSGAINMQLLTGFNEIADKAGFLVVYPEGIGLSWNGGGGCCQYAASINVDDITFVRQILSDVGTIASLDTKRIYAAGFAHGSSLVYRLACEMSETFAAIAPVEGFLVYSPCQPQKPVSVIHVHSLYDSHLPYAGGGHHNIPPVEKVIATWVELNGCTGSPTIDNPVKTIKHSAYTSCEAGTAVELYTVEGVGWVPDSVYPISETIWEFFAAHPKP